MGGIGAPTLDLGVVKDKGTRDNLEKIDSWLRNASKYFSILVTQTTPSSPSTPIPTPISVFPLVDCSYIWWATAVTDPLASRLAGYRYCASAGGWQWDVATSVKMTLTTAGKLGIGAAPINQLDVEGAAAIGATYSGTSAAPTNGLIVEGNVGIGTATVVNKLDIEGAMAVGASYSGTSVAPTDGVIIQGQVGIGTASPITSPRIQFLDVRGPVAINTTVVSSTEHLVTIGANNAEGAIVIVPASGTTTARPTLQFWKDSTPTRAMNMGIAIPGTGGALDDLVWSSFINGFGWTERMRLINANGDLLIGSTTDLPGTGLLQVTPSTAQGGLFLTATGAGVSAITFRKSNSDSLYFSNGMHTPGTTTQVNDLTWGYNDGTWHEAMRIVNASGDLLIGTTTDYARLSVFGHAAIANGSEIRLYKTGSTSVYTGISAATTQAGAFSYVLPIAQGAASTVLTNNGSGTLIWSSAATLGLVTGTGTVNRMTKWTSTTGALGDSNATDDGTTFTFAAGSVNAAQGGVSITQTWNTAGNPTAFKLNVTNTASGTTAKLFDWQVGGTPRLYLDKIGQIVQLPVHTTAGGTSFLISHSGPVSGAVNADFIGLKYQAFAIAPASGASNLMGLAFDMSGLSGVWASVMATSADAIMSGGTISDYRHFSAHLYGAGSNITTWSGYETAIDDAGSFAWGGTITDAHGFRFRNYNQAGTGAITNLYGILIESPDPGLTVTNFHAAAFDGNVNLTNDKTLYWGTATSTAWASRAAGITYDTTSTRLIVDRGGVNRVGFDGTAINLGTGFSLDWRAACTTTTAARGRFLYQTTGEQFEFYANASANASLIVNNNLVTVRTALAPNGDNAAVIGSQSLRWTELGVIKILSGASALALATDDGANTTTTRLSISAGAAGATVTVSDAVHFAFSTTGTGTKLGTGTTQLIGVWNAAPVARQSAYTQTYATADKTHAALTSATLTDNTGGTAGTTLAAIVGGGAACETTTKNAVASLSAQVNALRVDLEDAKQLINSVIDDFQTIGWLA